ncbi:MAG TPA: serine/threonine-protein kinase [Polyangiaceae bacterium]|jgi:serine/threonine-protein kinase|nr:serine/threonine-protein kinase [Polyangiaceae bacterium]
MLSEGATLDRYRIEVELGSGGMGRVYRAFDTRLHRRVALKVLLAPGLDGEERTAAVGRLIREARAAAALNHPNVVAVFDAGEAAGTPYIVMEYVPGTSLVRAIGDRSALWEERLRWLVDVARALGAAHHAGLVHRDIKPANVIVRDDGTVKVLDFGIAHIHMPDLARLLTTTGDGLASSDPKIVGTPMYMAPEHLRGDQIDGRADQFSWGVLAYELLSGQLPWKMTGAVSVISMILSKDPEPLTDIAPELPSEVAAAVTRALQKNPNDRFASMDDLVLALEPYLASMSMPPSLRILSRPLSSRRTPTISLHEIEVAPSSMRTGRVTDGGITPPAVGLTTTSQSISVPPPSGALRTAPVFGPGKEDGPSPTRRSSEVSPRRRRVQIAAVLALVALVAAVIGVLGRKEPPALEIASPIKLPAPTSLADLPPPEACRPEAGAAYMDGLRLLREGNYEQASGRFQAAADADPACAAAQMRVALMGPYFVTPARVAQAYKEALKLRRHLSPRDQALLDAYEPMRLRDPPDRSELSTRLLGLTERFPMDAEILVLAARESRASPEARILYAKRAAELDPQFSDAFQAMGKLLALTGKEAEALEVLEMCARVAPLSTDCLWQRSEIFRAAGRCEDLEADARRIIARSPGTSLGYAVLAEALAAQGSAPETLREVLAKRWERLREPERLMEQAADEVALEVLDGSFDRTEDRTRELDALAHDSDEVVHRALPLRYLAESRAEVGKDADVARVAGDFVRRRRAWGRRVDIFSTGLRGRFFDDLRLLELARNEGELSDDLFAQEADRFREASTSLFKLDERLVWAVSEAMPVRTAAEAEEALASFPGGAPSWSDPPVHFERAGFPHIFTGRALFLAGLHREAASYLRAGVSACNVLEDPFLNTRAHLWLGQALEQVGEPAKACSAYGVVIARWGKAKPASKTAEEASARSRELACSEAQLRSNHR